MQQVDRYVAARIRERRVLLGMSQIELASLVKTNYQSIYKMETGIHKISAGKMYVIAEALEVDMSYLYEGVKEGTSAQMLAWTRAWLDLARVFMAIPSRKQQEVLCQMAKILAEASKSVAGLADAWSSDVASDGGTPRPTADYDGVVWHV
jgi:transcriptional regulator with XRE-family HTH domain